MSENAAAAILLLLLIGMPVLGAVTAPSLTPATAAASTAPGARP